MRAVVATGSAVFGYVRLDRPDRRRLDQLRRRIAVYCAREGLALELIFGDNGVADTAMTRPGWTALLDALERTGGRAVVVPALGHLSASAIVRAELRDQLGRAGAMLHIATATPRGRGVSDAGGGAG